MSKRATEIVRATGEAIVLGTIIGTDCCLSIPEEISHHLKPAERVQMIVRKLGRW